MSTMKNIIERTPLVSATNNDISVTSFSGGAVRGPCIQLTQSLADIAGRPRIGHIQVDVDQAILMRDMLDHFIGQPSSQQRMYDHLTGTKENNMWADDDQA